MPTDRGRLPDDGIYRAILWAMVLTVVAGAVLAILGETVLHDPAMVRLGAWIAFVAAAIYAVFRWLGAREGRRRRAERRARGDDSGSSP